MSPDMLNNPTIEEEIEFDNPQQNSFTHSSRNCSQDQEETLEEIDQLDFYESEDQQMMNSKIPNDGQQISRKVEVNDFLVNQDENSDSEEEKIMDSTPTKKKNKSLRKTQNLLADAIMKSSANIRNNDSYSPFQKKKSFSNHPSPVGKKRRKKYHKSVVENRNLRANISLQIDNDKIDGFSEFLQKASSSLSRKQQSLRFKTSPTKKIAQFDFSKSNLKKIHNSTLSPLNPAFLTLLDNYDDDNNLYGVKSSRKSRNIAYEPKSSFQTARQISSRQQKASYLSLSKSIKHKASSKWK